MTESNQYIILRDLSQVDLGEMFSGRSPGISTLGLTAVPVPRVDLEALTQRDLADVRRDPQVVSIAPSMPIKLIQPVSTGEVDTAPSVQPGATWGVSVTGALSSPFTGQGIVPAILDTGIDASHEAFQGVELVQKDFSGEGDGDANGHGTHCAGTVFGRVINGYRFGVATGVQKAIIGKVLGSQGGGSTESIYQAILWALDQGANVISMSLGIDFPGLVDFLVKQQNFPVDLATSRALEAYRANVRLFDKLAGLVAARSMMFQGTVIVAASGNESRRDLNPDYVLGVAPPAAADGIVSVGALQTPGEPNNALKVAFFSNTGPNVAAPGYDIYSAKAGGGYWLLSGTSMATPHVAGIAALWAEKLVQQSGTVSAVELASRLIGQSTYDKLAPGISPLDVGAGLVQAPQS